MGIASINRLMITIYLASLAIYLNAGRSFDTIASFPQSEASPYPE